MFQSSPIRLNENLCIICQKRKSQTEKLSKLGESGKQQLFESAKQRQAAQDDTFATSIRRILNALGKEHDSTTYVYHRSCYSVFTSKEKIENVKKRTVISEKIEAEESEVNRVTRSKIDKADWNKCIICQTDTKERLRLVMSDEMSETLKDLAKFDYKLNIRVGAIINLAAADAKYHSSCILKIRKQKMKLESSGQAQSSRKDLPFMQICKEVRFAAAAGQASAYFSKRFVAIFFKDLSSLPLC